MCDFLTTDALKASELRFLKQLKKTCRLYDSAISERRRLITGNQMSYSQFRKVEYGLGVIRYNRKMIRIHQYSYESKRISFYGSREADPLGVLNIYLKYKTPSEDDIILSTNRALRYPSEGEILKIILKKYEIRSADDLESFWNVFQNKDIELI